MEQPHKESILLSHEENLKVFSLIEPKCLSLSSAVVQLYLTEYPHSHWVKRGTGVLCLIRDHRKRSYFLRLYCTMRNEMIWQHELYTNISFSRARSYFMTFEGQNNQVAINFASDEEAQDFYDTAVNYAYRMANRKKRRPHSDEEVKQPPPIAMAHPPRKSPDVQENLYEEIPHQVTLRKAEKPPETDFNSLFGPDRPRVQRKVGLNKNVISTPTNFVHVAHIGFDQHKGFDTRGETQIINQFLKKAGVYDAYTNDRETKAFIDDFMQQNNVIDEIKSELENDDSEITVRRNNNNTLKSNKHSKLTSKGTTPRTPPRQGPPMPNIPAPILPGAERHDTKTLKPTTGGGPPPPPPPPPPPMMDSSNGPPPPLAPPAPSQQRQQMEAAQDDPRSALLDSIRKGGNLKKVSPDDIDNRVAPNPPVDSSTKTDMLASALIRAITERRQHMVTSDNSDDEDHRGNDDDWE